MPPKISGLSPSSAPTSPRSTTPSPRSSQATNSTSAPNSPRSVTTTNSGLFSQPKTDYISVQSFSFESCRFKRNLFAFIREKNQHASEVICMVGANPGPQTTPSRLKLFRKISETIGLLLKSTKCKTDEYLIADTYGNRRAGYNYANAVDGHKNFDDYIIDTSRLSILYAQTHKTASEHPDKHIEFTFYGSDQANLYALVDFYKKNRKNLPLNTKLKLRLYNSKDVYFIADIDGKGPIDRDYEQNIKRKIAEVLTDSKGEIRKELLDGNLNLIHELKARENVMDSFLEESARKPLHHHM